MMKIKILLPVLLFAFTLPVSAQQLSDKISAAVKQLEDDPVFSHAILGIEIRDASSGKILFAKNNQKGLVPASTQKIITAAAFLEKYGTDFRFNTSFSLIKQPHGKNCLFVKGDFAPCPGSDRWRDTKPAFIFTRLLEALREKGIQKIDSVFIENPNPGKYLSPKWIWEDMGNYYGATSEKLNWKENQFAIHLRSASKPGLPVKILNHEGPENLKLVSELITGEKGSGDQAYVFHSPTDSITYIRGTIPPNENDFVIYASAFGPVAFYSDLKKESPSVFGNAALRLIQDEGLTGKKELLFVQESPSADSLVYWFLKKSLNLYGECFLQKLGNGNRNQGIDSVFSIIGSNEVDVSGMKIYDGSGLAPENRVSPAMLVSVMMFARKQSWWPEFYSALPVINNMHMKDGYITGYRCFAGVHKNSQGKEFVFALMANNYNATSAAARQKLWALLDLLK